MHLTTLASYLSRPGRLKKVEDALREHGVSKKTFYNWLNEDCEPTRVPDEFWPLVLEAATAKGEPPDELILPSGTIFRNPTSSVRALANELNAELAAALAHWKARALAAEAREWRTRLAHS